jgi:hypothetical protein
MAKSGCHIDVASRRSPHGSRVRYGLVSAATMPRWVRRRGIQDSAARVRT